MGTYCSHYTMNLRTDIFNLATGGHTKTPSTWMAATGLRSIIQHDPALLWLKYHGATYGFEEDSKEYSFLEWIGQKGRDFEAAWIANMAPDAVQSLNEDVDVRHSNGFLRTLELIALDTPVITKAALWWAPERIYGSADIIAKTSWLRMKFPRMQISDNEPDHYVILDCKFTAGLDQTNKKEDLAINSAQIRIYSYMLAHIQGSMPSQAYLITRDRIDNPIPVPVDQTLGNALDPNLAQMRDLHLHIKHHGAQYVPWADKIVACNFNNDHDAPWHNAKKRIAKELIPGRPMEWLTGVGAKQCSELQNLGFTSLNDILAVHLDGIPFETIDGLGDKSSRILRSVLQANRSGVATIMPKRCVPPKADLELFVDYEYLSNVNVDFDNDWPCLGGTEMVFMIGVGWEENGDWNYRQFVAAHENYDAERQMFEEFLSFLDCKGLFNGKRSAALYHWTNAEIWQSQRAADRLQLDRLRELPWQDLQKPFQNIPIAIPGAFNYGLKSIAQALGDYSTNHKVHWPDGLGEGLSAMVAGFTAYRNSDPINSPEMQILSKYLETDCKALWMVLDWMRKASKESIEKGSLKSAVLNVAWYRSVLASDRGLEYSNNERLGWYK